VLLWLCHPFNLIPNIPGLNKILRSRDLGPLILKTLLPNLQKRLEFFYHQALESSGIVSIDAPCLAQTARYFDGISHEVRLVPVPAEALFCSDSYKSNRSEATLVSRPPTVDSARNTTDIDSFIWIGRIADFKVPILKYTIARLEKLYSQKGKNATIHIVGDGPMYKNLQLFCAELKALRPNFYGQLDHASIRQKIDLNGCVALAMGTSALELGATGLPTLLLNFTYDRVVRHHDFDWLYNQNGYSVGELIVNKRSERSDELETRIEEAENKFIELGVLTRDYVNTNHGLNAVVEKLLAAICHCDYSWPAFEASLGQGRPWQYNLREQMTLLGSWLKGQRKSS
jgi:hypothetical protein